MIVAVSPLRSTKYSCCGHMRSAECRRHVRGKSELAGKAGKAAKFNEADRANRDKKMCGSLDFKAEVWLGSSPPKFRRRTARDQQFGMPDLTFT
jgi:hypothetical protein